MKFCRQKQELMPTTIRRRDGKEITTVDSLQMLEGLKLREVAPGWTPEEVQKLTEARLIRNL